MKDFSIQIEETSNHSMKSNSINEISKKSEINEEKEEKSELKLYDYTSVYNGEKDLVDKSQNKMVSLYSTFKYLRNKYNLENSRKNQIDCLVKKVKTKFIKALHEAIKYCVNLYIHRLPQYFVTNIKIDYNKTYLNKTIGEIYTEFKILPPLSELMEKKLYRKNKKELLILLMTSKLREIYEYYLQSDFFKYHYKNIKNREGENVAKLFDFTAHNICHYFLFNKGNKRKMTYKSNINKIVNNKINSDSNSGYNNSKFISYNNSSNNNQLKFEPKTDTRVNFNVIKEE